MLLSITVFTVFILSVSAFAQDYLWLEAENAEAVGYTIEENELASEGKLMTVNNLLTMPENEIFSLTFDLELSSTGKYDIWAVTSDITSRNFSELNWSIGEISGKADAKQCDLYTHNMAYVDQQITWTKISSDITINAGESKLVFSINSKAPGGPRTYMSAIDCVVIVPAEVKYVPDESMQRPRKRPHRFALIEMESPDNETFIGSIDTSFASGDKLLYAYDIPSPDGSDEETLYYSFMLDDDDEYDLWYLGAEMNVMHLSGTQWSVDDQEVNKLAAEPHNGVIIMNTVGAVNNLPIYWQKLGTETLSSGLHTLNIKYTYRALQGAERKHVIWADCVIVVPKSWNFTPPSNQDAQDRYPKYEIARLDARYFAEQYMHDDYTNIQENIILPDVNVLTPGGSKILGIGAEDCPVNTNGEVTRPYFDEGDMTFNLPVNAENEGVVSSYSVPASIKALEKYNVGEIKVDGELSETITVSVDVKLNTSQESDLTGSAFMIAALFDKNDTLIATGIKESNVTREITTLETTVSNTDKVDGVYLKVYLLNNRTLANKLCETKIVQ